MKKVLKAGTVMNQKIVDKILRKLLEQLVQGDENIEEFSKTTKLSGTTLRNINSRKGFTADSLIKLLLANGVSEDLLTNLPRSKPSQVSKTLTEWYKIGLSLTDKQRETIGNFVKVLKSDWQLRR